MLALVKTGNAHIVYALKKSNLTFPLFSPNNIGLFPGHPFLILHYTSVARAAWFSVLDPLSKYLYAIYKNRKVLIIFT